MSIRMNKACRSQEHSKGEENKNHMEVLWQLRSHQFKKRKEKDSSVLGWSFEVL